MHLNIIKVTYDKSIANTTRVPSFTTSIELSTKVLVRATRQEKNNRHPSWEVRITHISVEGDSAGYVENPRRLEGGSQVGGS